MGESFSENLTEQAISRRRALKKLAAGTAVAWSAPVISSLRTPAFAQAYPPRPGCTTVFSDTFEQEACGLNQALDNWMIVAGAIDVIGDSCGFVTTGSKVLDLDGSCGSATIDTNTTFPAGAYEVQFDLGGSQRGDTNSVRVVFGSLNEVITLPSSAPLTTFVRAAILASSAKLRFDHTVTVTNCIGLLLDNVIVRQCTNG